MTAADNDTSTTDIINRLRDSLRPVNPPLLRNADIAAAANEIERLRERCEGYKGQIEAGAIAIEHLRANRAVAAPPGWKLVPEEPTEAMVAEGGRSGGFDGYWCEDHTKEIYRAMLDYAPPPPCSPDHAEVERLRERCHGYKGQVEAGSIAIQHLQGEIDRLRDAVWAAIPWIDDLKELGSIVDQERRAQTAAKLRAAITSG